MASMASLDRVFKGSVSLKWKRFARASKYIREMESFLILLQPEATMPPSAMLSSGLGMISSGSTSS